MGTSERKNIQTTISVRMGLQGETLRYAELLERSPSTLVNDLLEEIYACVRADDPTRPMVVLSAIRKALGKEAHLKLREEFYRQFFGVQPPETEHAMDLARANASRSVPLMKSGKQKQQPYDEVRPSLFGLLEAAITEEVGDLYETDLMARAATEEYDPAKVLPQDFFSVMVHTTELYNRVYQLFLKDHLAREVIREIPKHFLPRS